ncbi:MAG TPA: hypothetical protein VGQ99_10345 [Tepidisphaeraceae bacterium]|nr:hypothetical protein [Tepidisphaeraceae bacterium]
MRVLLAGFILLFLTAPAFAQAEAEGEVESIGYGGSYRPNTWTPMKLRLRPKVGDTRTYKIAIVQEDLDRDRVLYTRPFTLNGNPPGGRIEEHVWVYFMPQPRDLRIQGNAAEFTNLIRIFLCKEDGKQLLQIPIVPGTSLPRSLDDRMDTYFGPAKGTRLVLLVGGSTSQPLGGFYDRAVGLTEDVEFYKITPSEMPGDVKGFHAVDAIVWLGSDPAELRAESLAAIQDYVRDGGKLVVTQGQNWQKFKESELAPLLPVTLDGVQNEKGAASLRMLAGMPNFDDPEQADINKLKPPWRTRKNPTAVWEPNDPWFDLQGKEVPVVKATPKKGAFVNLYCESDKSSPYLARWTYGLGSVVWVAQDFGDKQIISNRPTVRQYGWQAIWDRTMDWRNETLISLMDKKPDMYTTGTQNKTDLSRTVLAGMELPRRGAALVALAMVLFIGYWLVAGPGSYFFLLSRRRAYYSWVAFAVCALGATALTAAIVKLVLRGPPQLQHVTFVHIGPDRETVAHSQFGLYIPRDGNQHIELTDIAPKRFSYVIPYPVHPDHVVDAAEFPAYKEYEIPMRDRSSAEAPAIDVPYRSTLKKFSARWVGASTGGIDGKASLVDGRFSGLLTNNTGHDLRFVFLIFTRQPDLPYQNADDEMISLRDPTDGRGSWANGGTIDLADIYGKLAVFGTEAKSNTVGFRGPLNRIWMANWGEEFKSSIGSGDRYYNNDRAALLMTIFDRLWPGKLTPTNERPERYELLRRAGRQFDASSAVSAGQLLIFAKAEDAAPLPFPLKVEGEQVKGEGLVYYQVIIPMERGGAATQPMNRDSSIYDLGSAPAVDTPQPQPQVRPPTFTRPRPKPR